MKPKNPRPAKSKKTGKPEQPAKPEKPAPNIRKEFVPCRMCDGEGYRGSVPCDKCGGAGEVIATVTRPEGAPLPADNGNHPGGRTPKHTPEMIELLSEGISRGMTDQQAADLAEIDVTTLQDWFKSDAEFSRPIKKARAERLLSRLRYIEGANENWQSIAWLLERAHGSQFAPPKTIQRLEHSLANGMEDAAIKEAEEMLGMM